MGKKAKKRRGRPPKFVRDSTGKFIYGLSAQPYTKNGKTKQRFYATYSDPRKWFGFTPMAAMDRYARWIAEQGLSPPPGTFIIDNRKVEFKTSRDELKEADQPLKGNRRRRRPFSYLRIRRLRRTPHTRRPAKPPAPPDKQGKLFECK